MVSLPAAAATRNTGTQKLVSDYSRKEPLRSGIFGVLAVRGADTLAQYNRQVKMVPASNVKLITTGLALRQFGPDWRFTTTIAYRGNINDGILDGDLYIIGGGDPTTGAQTASSFPTEETFASWKALLDAAGIKGINGRIIGDPRYFKRPSYGMSWQAEDLGYSYGAGPSGLNFFLNAQQFTITPAEVGKHPNMDVLYPEVPWMSYINSAVTGEARSANTLYYTNSEYGPVGEFHGSFPADRKSYKLEASNSFGAYTCAYHFYKFLRQNGMDVSGGYADISPDGNVRTDLLFSNIGAKAADSKSLTVIGQASSPKLADIVKDTNFDSNNFYAETLFNMLAVNMYGSADRAMSEKAAEEMLIGMGLKPSGSCQLLDGSGLSRKDYVSAEFFVKFLRMMDSSAARDAYIGSLPSPGSKSTLKNRMKGAPEDVKERVRMKSGSMNGVLCMSGYILPADGNNSKTIYFSILTNNVTAPSSKVGAIIDEIILSLSQEP